MNGWLWLFVVGLLLFTFGLGCIFARAQIIHNGKGFHDDRLMSDRRASAVLGVFFTGVALFVVADMVLLQVRFTRFSRTQIECNTRAIHNERAIQAQRRIVDSAAVEYDIAQHDWLVLSTTKPVIPPDDPVYRNISEKLHAVTMARLDMLKVYSEHPPVQC